MEIAIIAGDRKKELMTQFCIAYCGILSRHHLCATHITGKYISEATGLERETFLAGTPRSTLALLAKARLLITGGTMWGRWLSSLIL